ARRLPRASSSGLGRGGDDNRAVAEEPTSSGSARVARAAMGERLAGFIYGTIVVLSVIVAGARAFPESPGHIAGVVVVTCAVFWLAHVYAHAVGESVSHGHPLSLGELAHIARREGSLAEAAVPPVVALVLGELGVFSEHAAIWIAFVLGLIVLGAQGLVFARMERLGLMA